MKKPEFVERFEEIEEAGYGGIINYVITEDEEMHFFPEFEKWKEKQRIVQEKRRLTLLNKKLKG